MLKRDIFQQNNISGIKDVFDLFDEEVRLLEQRILHIENLQYKLRQFSITLWIAILGVAMGVNIQKPANLFLMIIATFTPLLFMYIDAWYATNAQNLRSRRNEITHFLNFGIEGETQRMSKMTDASRNIDIESRFPLLDLTGYVTVKNDPQTIYRRSIIAKLSRCHRVLFYGFQFFGSISVLSYTVASLLNNNAFYLLIGVYPLLVFFLYRMNHLKRQKVIRETPDGYHKIIDNGSDKPSYLNSSLEKYRID